MQTAPARVLLIAGDPDFQQVAQTVREAPDSQLRLDRAESLQEGLATLTKGEHDICLLACGPDSADGLRALRRVREQVGLTPVILLTLGWERGLAEAAINLGADECIDKSHLNARHLERAIRYAVERAAATRALRESQAKLEALLAESRRLLAKAEQTTVGGKPR